MGDAEGHSPGRQWLCHRVLCALTRELIPAPEKRRSQETRPTGTVSPEKGLWSAEVITHGAQSACLPSPGVPCETGSREPAYQRKGEGMSDTGVIDSTSLRKDNFLMPRVTGLNGQQH